MERRKKTDEKTAKQIRNRRRKAKKKQEESVYPINLSQIKVKIIKKRQSDDESIEDDDEQINGYTDENQQRLKPKKRQELLNGDKPKVF
ncbi:unnamed protein product [Rotaria sordida]|uniref:Uncharacterized protein n=1 Tax=Rotaria sordida TaxID=392033 RepID=A0A813WLS6_9BILA|nr:unnamed protein product [Rotaria sordida]